MHAAISWRPFHVSVMRENSEAFVCHRRELVNNIYLAPVMPLTLKTTQMMSFWLLSPHTRNMQTSGQLQHPQDEQ